MKSRTLAIAALAVLFTACATEDTPKPPPGPTAAEVEAKARADREAAAREAAAREQAAKERAAREKAEQEASAKAAAAAAAAKKPAIVNLASTELFEFNKAVLTDGAKKTLDTEVVAKLKEVGEVRYINVNGHADRLGSATYNQKLSEKRADAVRAYLVSKGVDAGKVETFGFGKTTPAKSCPDQKDRKGLIECLAPNRRVVVEIQGTPR
jgi:OOP family OmpA-OmpF porin